MLLFENVPFNIRRVIFVIYGMFIDYSMKVEVKSPRNISMPIFHDTIAIGYFDGASQHGHCGDGVPKCDAGAFSLKPKL